MVVDLAESRAKIDVIDKEIVRLFEERMEIAGDVAAYKQSTGKKVFDPEREEQKLEVLRDMATGEFNKTGIEGLFRQIISISRKYQYQKLGIENEISIPFRQVDRLDVNSDTRIVCFGEHGSHTEKAMEEVFGMDITASNRASFREVMEMVAGGEAKYGILPIENSSTGGIVDTYDLLLDFDVAVVAEHMIKIDQTLLGTKDAKLSDIRTVYSHPQGLMQCAKFLEEHSDISAKTYTSTSGAAKKVAADGDKSQAAIAGKRAADIFGLKVLKEDISLSNSNYTRFIVISNQKVFLKQANKISIAFEIKHQAGTLYNMLANFYYNGLNLTKIESRPIEERNWEYRFFVDVEGNLNDSGVCNALASVGEFASQMRILGNIMTK